MKQIMSTEEFILKCNIKHNYRYDYTNTTYTGGKSKVQVICREHGQFIQQASHHLRGNGCKICSREQNAIATRKPFEEIIRQASEVHGDKYDYSLVKYASCNKPVNIVCKVHGVFTQRMADHIRGSGCSQCIREGFFHNFVETANRIHNNKYSYKMTTEKSKIVVICPVHGESIQYRSNHLKSNGCNACGIIKTGDSNRMSQNTFIERCTATHNNKYDYTKTLYTTSEHKIIITCPSHGDFTQKAQNHLNLKQGCPKCVVGGKYTLQWFNSEKRKHIAGCLYIISLQNHDEQFFKIGISKYSAEQRWKHLKSYNYDLCYSKEGTLYNMFLLEQHMLHQHVYKNRYIPKLKIGGDKECFKHYNIAEFINELEKFHNSLS